MLHQPRPFLNHAGGGVGKIYAFKIYDQFFYFKNFVKSEFTKKLL